VGERRAGDCVYGMFDRGEDVGSGGGSDGLGMRYGYRLES